MLDYKKRNHRKSFYLCTSDSASDSNIDEALKSMHQRITTKMKNYDYEDRIVLDVIMKYIITIFEC